MVNWKYSPLQTLTIDDRQFWLLGTVPKDEPDCGYTGQKCNNNPFYIAAGALAFVGLALLGALCCWRQRLQQSSQT